MNVITAVPTTPTRNSNGGDDSYKDFLNIASNPTNNDDFIDNAPVANQMLSSITATSPTRKSNNKQPSKMAVETYHGETRPTFDELQSIERHRREILLRVSFYNNG
jgi:hypothetical protein